MNFVQKKYFALFERSEDRGQVSLAFEERAGAGLDGDAELTGDDLREGRQVEVKLPDQPKPDQRVAQSFSGR